MRTYISFPFNLSIVLYNSWFLNTHTKWHRRYVFRTLKSIALSESFGDPSWNTVRRSAMEMANCIGTQMDWTKSSLCRDTTGIELLHDLFDRMSVIHDERSAEIASHLMSLCMSACCKNSKVVSEWERRKDLESKTRASRSTTPMKVLRNPHAEGGGGGTGGGRNRSLSLVRWSVVLEFYFFWC